MTTILATSDLHGYLTAVEPCYILIIAGDICPISNHDIYYQLAWLDRSFFPWLGQLITDGVKNIVYIAGNHDFVFQSHYRWIAEVAQRQKLYELPIYYLQDSGVIIDGITLWGTPWVPNLPSWAFYANKEKQELAFSLIPERLDILVSHGPPHGVRDAIPNRHITDDNECEWPQADHVGSVPLREAILAKQPKKVITGHIHEARGQELLGNTLVQNVSFLDASYKPYQTAGLDRVVL